MKLFPFDPTGSLIYKSNSYNMVNMLGVSQTWFSHIANIIHIGKSFSNYHWARTFGLQPLTKPSMGEGWKPTVLWSQGFNPFVLGGGLKPKSVNSKVKFKNIWFKSIICLSNVPKSTKMPEQPSTPHQTVPGEILSSFPDKTGFIPNAIRHLSIIFGQF